MLKIIIGNEFCIEAYTRHATLQENLSWTFKENFTRKLPMQKALINGLKVINDGFYCNFKNNFKFMRCFLC